MKDVETPQQNTPIVGPDGRLTPYGQIVLQKLTEALRELQALVAGYHP